MNTLQKGFGYHDAFYDGAQFSWDREGFPAAYAPADGKVSGDDEITDALGCLGMLGVDASELVEMGFDADDLVELGFSLKKFGKGLVKGIGKVGKVALKVAKVAAPIAAFVIPGGVALTAGIAGADKLISAAQKGSKAAKKAYSATKALAASGHPDAKKALTVLSQVNAKRKAAGVPPGQPLPLKPAAKVALQRDAKALQKPVAVPSVSDSSVGFFVDLHGRTKHGRFRAA